MDAILQKFRDKFIEEAQGLLDRLEKDLLEMEQKPDKNELTESAFRAMHTLKGISSMYGFNYISEFTHHLESIWQCVRDQKKQFSKEISEITFHSIDHIRKLLDDEKLELLENKNNHQNLLDAVIRISELTPMAEPKSEEKENSKQKAVNSWHILLRINERIAFRGINLINIMSDLVALGDYEISKVESLCDSDTDVWSIILTSTASVEELKEVLLFIEDECTLVNLTSGNILSNSRKEEILSFIPKNETSLLEYSENFVNDKIDVVNPEEVKKLQESTLSVKQLVKRISVDAVKLDHLMFLVSELITVNAQLILSSRNDNKEQMALQMEKIDALSRQFRNNALEIRLVPLSDTVLRFQRLIRDLSKQLGKDIEFKTSGVDTELDKNTIDRLAEPLMHIIRNCIDHGIESPEIRIQKGKPEQGVINLSAYNSGSFVFICISDDGNGIDVEKVRQKAIDQGLLKPTDNPGKKELFDLIFLPGFSTAQSLTSVSGRGVGMDVVKKHIGDLRGEIYIDSEPGEGTVFTLKLQQSLSIIDTLLFSVQDNYFTVPISEIEVCMECSFAEISDRKHTATIPYKDHLIPFVDLRYLFNMSGDDLEIAKVIIIKNENKELALLSDFIIGEHQAVSKPLGRSFHNQKYITSASQLGDGNMAFMIDTNALLKLNSY